VDGLVDAGLTLPRDRDTLPNHQNHQGASASLIFPKYFTIQGDFKRKPGIDARDGTSSGENRNRQTADSTETGVHSGASSRETGEGKKKTKWRSLIGQKTACDR